MPKSSPFRGVTLFRPTGKWRAQISANGRTTSLGDHDTQEAAAAAFDRAAINKDGAAAKTNFDRDNYAAEMTVLASLSFNEIVAELRARARKGVGHSSHYRGVSLLRATGRWHAQINAAGKQVHLGFFATEAAAARAYDRAALAKAAGQPGGGGAPAAHVQTNFDCALYREEVAGLQRMSSPQLLAALARDPLASADPEPSSGHSPCRSDAAVPSEAGWFEGDVKAAGGMAAQGPSSRGNSNASSMDVLPPHHFGSEAASPPTSPTLQRGVFQHPSPHTSPTLQHNGMRHAAHSPHAADAYFGGGIGARAVRTGSAHLRDPQPDSLQAQLRALNHLPLLPPRAMAPNAGEPDAPHLWQAQQQQQQQHWQLAYPSGHAVVTSTAVLLPQDGWLLSPARYDAGGTSSGARPFGDAAAVAAPPSPELLSPERPHRDSPQRTSRRQAGRKGSSALSTPEPLQAPRERVAGSKRGRPAAQLMVAEAAPAFAPPPLRHRRKGTPMRAAY